MPVRGRAERAAPALMRFDAAISGLMPARPFRIAESVFRLTPRDHAASVTSVEIQARQVHVAGAGGRVQTAQDQPEPFGVTRPHAVRTPPVLLRLNTKINKGRAVSRGINLSRTNSDPHRSETIDYRVGRQFVGSLHVDLPKPHIARNQPGVIGHDPCAHRRPNSGRWR